MDGDNHAAAYTVYLTPEGLDMDTVIKIVIFSEGQWKLTCLVRFQGV